MYSVASCATYAVEICYLALLKQTDLSDAFESECKFFYFSKLQNNNILNHDHHSETILSGSAESVWSPIMQMPYREHPPV